MVTCLCVCVDADVLAVLIGGMFVWYVLVVCFACVLFRYANDRTKRRGTGGGGTLWGFPGGRPGTSQPRQATFLLMSFVLLFLNMHVLPIYAKMHIFTKCLSMRVWHPQVGLPLLYSGMEKPRWSYYHFPLCMVISIMLIDSPSVGYRKAWPKVGPLFGKEKLFYQNKRFYENLGRDIPDPSEFIKWSYSGGVWFWKMFSDEKRFW